MLTKSVFISYAHKDGGEFSRRLEFALSMYMDVFRDIRLRTGPFPPQLFEKIETTNFFILVMSPYSLRKDGWCMKELRYAERANPNGIGLAKIYPQAEANDADLTETYTFGNFTEDFEAGFRRLTAMMLGSPHSSWEAFVSKSDEQVIQGLKQGLLPGLIAKSLAEWVLVERTWPILQHYIHEDGRGIIITGTPRTPEGIQRQCDWVLKQFSRNSPHSAGRVVSKIHSVNELAKRYVNELQRISDMNHRQCGEVAGNIIEQTEKFMKRDAAAKLDAMEVARLNSTFRFDVSEKIRELINIHARRSRYLY